MSRFPDPIYSLQLCFASLLYLPLYVNLRQVGGFLRVPQFPPPIKLTATIQLKYLLKVALNTITLTKGETFRSFGRNYFIFNKCISFITIYFRFQYMQGEWVLPVTLELFPLCVCFIVQIHFISVQINERHIYKKNQHITPFQIEHIRSVHNRNCQYSIS